jgi:hypothetical protein
MTAYQERVVAQTRRWVEGRAEHNRIDDECCPDFSCCEPRLYTQDRGERMEELRRLLHRYNQPAATDA